MFHAITILAYMLLCIHVVLCCFMLFILQTFIKSVSLLLHEHLNSCYTVLKWPLWKKLSLFHTLTYFKVISQSNICWVSCSSCFYFMFWSQKSSVIQTCHVSPFTGTSPSWCSTERDIYVLTLEITLYECVCMFRETPYALTSENCAWNTRQCGTTVFPADVRLLISDTIGQPILLVNMELWHRWRSIFLADVKIKGRKISLFTGDCARQVVHFTAYVWGFYGATMCTCRTHQHHHLGTHLVRWSRWCKCVVIPRQKLAMMAEWNAPQTTQQTN